MVSSLFAALYRHPDIEKHEPAITVPFESMLEITGEKQTPDGLFHSVRMPQGWTLWVQSGDIEFAPAPLTIGATIELGRRFLGLPYRWGGTTALGFDCSGFTQMLMRRRGIALPRDSRPQAKWEGLIPVERSELLPGDLLFFGKTPERINHTGMYIGAGEFIHATRRGRPSVQIGVLAAEPWTSQYITARRAK
jgi:cell wall-associated NlpC family hydrolase